MRSPAASLRAFVQRSTRPLDFFGYYKSRVAAQSADGKTVDLQPEDSRIGGLNAVPVKLGIPGTVAKVSAGAFMLLGWEAGDPRKPVATLWDGGESVTELVITATTIKLGASTGTQPTALGTDLESRISGLETAYNAHNHPTAPTGPVSPPNVLATGTPTFAAQNVQVK